MEEDLNLVDPTFNTIQAENGSVVNNQADEMQQGCSHTPGKDLSTLVESTMACKILTLRSVSNDSSYCQRSAEISEQLSPQAVNSCLISNSVVELKDVASEHGLNTKQLSLDNTEDKENATIPSATITPGGYQPVWASRWGGSFFQIRPGSCV